MKTTMGWGQAGLVLALLTGLGGCGSDDPPATSAPAACTGVACATTPPVVGPLPETPAPVTSLCPKALDYSTTYTGASSGGEYIKVSFDTTSQRYRMTFVDSSVPTAAGQVNSTRTGLTIEGSFTHTTALPTAEQNRCTFVLQDGQTSNASYSVRINPANPPMLMAGFGVVTGGVPGASIQFDGVALLGNLGAVPARTIDSFPFIGFLDTETDLSQVAGRYHVVGMYVSPSGNSYQTAQPQGWSTDPANWTETLNADGTCTPEGNGYSCRTTGSPWTRRQNADNSQDNVFVSRPASTGSPFPSAGNAEPIVLLAPSQAHGILIVGKVGTQRIPVVVRIGNTYVPSDVGNLLNTIMDNQVGLSLLAPATALQANAFDGKFVGVSSAPICAKFAYNGNSGSPAAGDSVFNASVDHPDLPGVFHGTFFMPDVGNCLESAGTFSPAAAYVGNLFSGADGTQASIADTSTTPSLSLDYAQSIPGKVKVSALRSFVAEDPSGNVTLFSAGDVGTMIRNGPVYALIMNSNKYYPFLQFGMALP